MVRPSWRRFWDLLGAGDGAPAGRTHGDPPSANGASSLHLRWDLDDRPGCREVSVTLEVLQPPTVDRLYFWALQADFATGDAGRRPAGGAHLGLQWHPQHPGSTAVNVIVRLPPGAMALMTPPGVGTGSMVMPARW